jgi:hypothetical protein
MHMDGWHSTPKFDSIWNTILAWNMFVYLKHNQYSVLRITIKQQQICNNHRKKQTPLTMQATTTNLNRSTVEISCDPKYFYCVSVSGNENKRCATCGTFQNMLAWTIRIQNDASNGLNWKWSYAVNKMTIANTIFRGIPLKQVNELK